MYQIKEQIDIKNIIYEVRGKKVMLDSDLAKLYKYPKEYFKSLIKDHFDLPYNLFSGE